MSVQQSHADQQQVQADQQAQDELDEVLERMVELSDDVTTLRQRLDGVAASWREIKLRRMPDGRTFGSVFDEVRAAQASALRHDALLLKMAVIALEELLA